MKNKISIVAMIFFAMALIVGCEDHASSTKTVTASEVPTQGTETQELIDNSTVPAQLSTTVSQLNINPNATETVTFSIKNTSHVKFLAGNLNNETNSVDLIIDVMDANNEQVSRSVMHLPTSLAAGQEGTYQVPVAMPGAAGKYTLDINLVQQGKFYFKDAGVKSIQIPLTVTAE